MNNRAARLCPTLVSATSLILFICLAIAVTAGATLPFDYLVRSAVHGNASNFLTSLAYGFSLLGSLWLLIFLSFAALAGFWVVGSRRSAIALFSSMAGSIVLNNVLKFVFHRMRPDPFFGAAPETYSFPSGHVLFSCCFYVVLTVLLLSSVQDHVARFAIRAAVILLLSGIGWSRIYLGVHYPTDVVGGLLVAIFWIAGLRSLGLFGTST
jgi:undecaprenyl-diphosphatase